MTQPSKEELMRSCGYCRRGVCHIHGDDEEVSDPTEPKVELLPCPFCGSSDLGDPNFECDYGIQCNSCGAMHGHEDRDEAIRLWNTRATAQPEGWRLMPVDAPNEMLVAGRIMTHTDWRKLLAAAPKYGNGK